MAVACMALPCTYTMILAPNLSGNAYSRNFKDAWCSSHMLYNQLHSLQVVHTIYISYSSHQPKTLSIHSKNPKGPQL